MNKRQAEGRVNSRLYSRTQEKKVQHSSAIKKQWSTIVSLYKVIFAYSYGWTGLSKVSSKDIG